MRFYCRHHGLSTREALRLVHNVILFERWNRFIIDLNRWGIGVHLAWDIFPRVCPKYGIFGFRALNRVFGIERSN